MNGTRKRDFDEWLEAESAGLSDEADARFALLFAAHVPKLDPPGGLADRVLAALGFRMPAWDRVTAVLALALGGGASALFWVDRVPWLVREAASAALGAWRFVSVAGDWVVQFGQHAFGVLASVGRAFGVVAATGPVAAAIALNLTVAFIALAALQRLLSHEEE
jgi:hypothetical protein